MKTPFCLSNANYNLLSTITILKEFYWLTDILEILSISKEIYRPPQRTLKNPKHSSTFIKISSSQLTKHKPNQPRPSHPLTQVHPQKVYFSHYAKTFVSRVEIRRFDGGPFNQEGRCNATHARSLFDGIMYPLIGEWRWWGVVSPPETVERDRPGENDPWDDAGGLLGDFRQVEISSDSLLAFDG